jgi:phosphatidate phosphatase
MFPYREDTISDGLAAALAVLSPMIVILATEIMRSKISSENEEKVQMFNREIPNWIVNVYKHIGAFFFGGFSTELFVDVTKNIVGRFRPHFMNVCKPIMSDGTDCSNFINFNRYIEDFMCSNAAATSKQLREMRISFPSGHASLAFFTAVFITLYLHYKMTWRGSKLLKHFVQLFFILGALAISLSRISDYKHHCEYEKCVFNFNFNSCIFITFNRV